jgi:hypothetical protein
MYLMPHALYSYHRRCDNSWGLVFRFRESIFYSCGFDSLCLLCSLHIHAGRDFLSKSRLDANTPHLTASQRAMKVYRVYFSVIKFNKVLLAAWYFTCMCIYNIHEPTPWPCLIRSNCSKKSQLVFNWIGPTTSL